MQHHQTDTGIVVGVDTHKHTHAVVALSALGVRLGATTVPASSAGYRRLASWALALGRVTAFGVEGTGSYGAGLARALHQAGHRVLEVNRPDRSARRRNGKDDMLDALVSATAPQLTAAPGIANGTAAALLLLVGDNPGRIRSECALAKLCGACPIPASSGRTNRHRLNRGGNRQANAALHRIVVTRMRMHKPTTDYVARCTNEGKTKPEIMRCLKRYVAREVFSLPCKHPVAMPEPA
ncbi:transposase [Roseomonas sp. CCTCC AB2023176]|uniref:transposase n=1 Tax=Roseomonas sp. CCTCC AB2023176 TaxID=3342640 RepID=UPI0035DE79DB